VRCRGRRLRGALAIGAATVASGLAAWGLYTLIAGGAPVR
jgi:hypothetical protein